MRRTQLQLSAVLAIAALLCAGAGCRSAEAAREHEREGARLLQIGRMAEGVAELEAALDEDPGSVQAATSLAAIYERSGDRLRALDILTAVVREKPGVGLARMSLANLYVRIGRLEDALAQYAAVGQGASHAPAFLGMADIYQARGESAAAERAILAAIQAEPTAPSPRYRLARLYDSVGRPEARGAWERFLSAAVGNPDERTRIDEANTRLRILAPALSGEEQAAFLATLRRHLATIPVGPAGQIDPAEATAIAGDAGPAILRRFYSGRTHVRLRAPGAPLVRGAGSGASLYEGCMAAAEDLRRSRVYDVYYAGALGRARAEVYLEVGEPEPLTLLEPDPRADLVPAEGGPFDDDDLLEWRDGATTIVVLPTDRAAQGLATLRAALAWAATEAGLPADEWRKGTLRRVRVRGFIEDEPAGWAAGGARAAVGEGPGLPARAGGAGERAAAGGAADDSPSVRGAGIGRAAPVDLEGGLPAPPAADRTSALAAARAGAAWMVGLLGAEGGIPSAYDPRTGALAPPTVPTQELALEALRAASQATGEGRLASGATLAGRWLAVERLRASTGTASAEAAPGGAAPAPPPPLPDHASEAFALALEIEGALAELDERASARPPAVPPAGKAPLAGTSARASAAAAAAEAAAARTAAERRLAEAVREALRLSIDPCASALYQDRARPLGAFREGRFDPRVTLEGTARLVSALCRAAPRLRADATPPSKS